MAASQANRVIEQLRKALQAGGAGVSDGQLLACFVGHRDEAAFEALVRRHGPMVLGVCRRVLGNHHDAEDAFQADLPRPRPQGGVDQVRETVANWLYGVAYNGAEGEGDDRAAMRERQVAEMPEPARRRTSGLTCNPCWMRS